MFHLLRVKFNKIVLFSSLFPKKQKHFELNIGTPTEVQMAKQVFETFLSLQNEFQYINWLDDLNRLKSQKTWLLM